MEATIEQKTERPKRRRGRKALLLGLFIVLAVLGGRWFWRQVQFTRLREPLIKAVQEPDTARVHELLSQGADPNVRVNYKPEAFTWTNLLNMLRGRSSDPGNHGTTVLMDAASTNEIRIVRLLLEYGAEVGLRDADLPLPPSKHSSDLWPRNCVGDTALHYAAEAGSIECMRALLHYGADARVKNGFGETPLLKAVQGDSNGYVRFIPPLGQSCVNLLLQQRVEVNTTDQHGSTPLIEAALISSFRGVRSLVEAGADLDAQDRDGQTPLHLVIQNRHPNDSYGMVSPVERAEYLALIGLLLDRGADITIRDKTGKTALQIAENLPDEEVVSLLHKAAARAPRAGKAAGR